MMGPMGQQGPMMGPMGQRGPMMGPMGQQGPMMGQMGQQGPMMGPMGQQGPTMGQQGPMMGQQRPMMGQRGPMSPMMGPMGQQGPMHGRSTLRSVLSGVKGQVVIPLRNMQNVMELESQLGAVRRELVQGFYMDLMAYKQISTQFKKRMAQKLSMIRQIEAKLASPIRRALATGRMQLPMAPPPKRSSTVITTYTKVVPTKVKAGDDNKDQQ